MLVRLALRGRRGCMSRPRLTSLARHYSEVAAAVATEPQEEQTSPGKPKTNWHPHLTLMQHVLGIHPDEKLPSKLSRASRLTGSTMLDVLIVAFDLEARMAAHEWSQTNRGGAVIGVSILDTRQIRHELRSEAALGSLGLEKAFRPLQFHVLSDRSECRSYISRQAPRFTFGTSMELQAEDVSPTMQKLLAGRDVITVFHHASNDVLLLESFGVKANKRQLFATDTWSIAVALGIPSGLEMLSRLLFIDSDVAHVAGNDALATLKALCHLATLLPDPLFGTHNDHGRLLQSRLLPDGADHLWLADEMSSMVRKLDLDRPAASTELALEQLADLIHARRSRGQNLRRLERRHWNVRVAFELNQIRQQDEDLCGRLRDQQRALLRQLQRPLEPSSANPSKQPLLPTPPPEEAGTAHTQTATTDSVDKNQAIADTALTPAQRHNKVVRSERLALSIARAVGVRHEMHTECLFAWVRQLRTSWSRRSGEMKQWAVSIHHVNRQCAAKLFQIERKYSVQVNLDILADHQKASAAVPSQSCRCPSCLGLSSNGRLEQKSRGANLQPSGEHQSSVVEESRCEDPISQELETNWMV